MKLLPFLLGLLIMLSACTKNNEPASFDFNITNFADTLLVVEYNNTLDTIYSGEANFSFATKQSYAGYVGVYYGNEFMRLYLSPGDKLTINTNYDAWLKGCEITGTGKATNNYLLNQALEISEHKTNSSDFIYSATQEDYLLAFDDLRGNLYSSLKKFKKDEGKDVDEFADIEEKRIKIIMYNMRLNYGSFIDYSSSMNDSEKAVYYAFTDSLDFSNKALSNIPEFLDLATTFIDWKVNNLTINDTSLIKDYKDYINLTFKVLNDKFENSSMLETLYYNKLLDMIKYMGITNLELIYDEYKKMDASAAHILEVEKAWAEWERISKGKTAPKFTYPDINRKEYSLEDFKGNLVYIDVWATWCGPCKQEVPAMIKLEKKFANNNIVFVGISLDTDKDSWVNMLQTQKLSGYQLYAGDWDTPICNEYLIRSIPRFILIDAEGNIIDANAPRPSDGAEELINELLDL